MLIAIMIGLTSCDQVQSIWKQKRVIDENDVLLASVEDKKMYLSDIDEMIIANTAADSLNQLNGYIESWLKRNVVLNEAEVNFPSNVDIDKLVEDYRESLVLHNYRQLLIEKDLDTTITESQEKSYYEANKDQYLLRSAICKGQIAVVPETAPRMEKFYKNWKKNDSTAILKYIDQHAINSSMDDNTWYTIDEFLAFLPSNAFKNSDIKKKGDLQKNYEDFEYFVKINEVINKNDIAPMSYVRKSIRKVIIHQRKRQILDNIEQNLYQKYLQANRVKVYEG